MSEHSEATIRAWRAFEFMECDTCRAKPGTPPLCVGCLHNRMVISSFMGATEPQLNGARTRAEKLFSDALERSR